MSGIVGIVNHDKDISNQYSVIRNMNNTLSRRGPDEEGFFFEKHVNFGHCRLIVSDPIYGKQPMSCIYNDVTYTIIYDGNIYNAKELKDTLISNGFEFKSNSDTEILLKAFIHYGYDVCKHLNGVFAFAIWNNKKEELFC